MKNLDKTFVTVIKNYIKSGVKGFWSFSFLLVFLAMLQIFDLFQIPEPIHKM